MNIYRIDFTHYGPKDSQEGTWGLMLARDDEHLFDKLTHHHGPCNWDAEDTMEVWDDEKGEEVSVNVKEQIVKMRGDWWVELEDCYYGATQWEWERVANATGVAPWGQSMRMLRACGLLREVEFDLDIAVVAAVGVENGAIGLNGDLPWKLAADLKRFKTLTSGHTVIMGRKTWESIPPKYRPLPNRTNIVLSRDVDFRENLEQASAARCIEGALMSVLRKGKTHEQKLEGTRPKVFIIGGASVFVEGMKYANEVHLTWVEYDGPKDQEWDAKLYLREAFWDVAESEVVEADEKNSHRSEYKRYVAKRDP